ncbi:hypothetical protein ABXT08_01100 [Chryseobacterium sp. NRRL B-14859]|uniref:hypothetical protein n=1 Tax=unclassified Chryseobacterium TaxID=2593645 RepID=UPI001616845C|nr:hypothetical protein [Chryseobacterium sp. G0240]
MKKSKILKRKLNKSELKEINGGYGSKICVQGLCFMPGSDEAVIGLLDRYGNCC